MTTTFRKTLTPEEIEKVQAALSDSKKLYRKYFLDDELRDVFNFSGVTRKKMFPSVIISLQSNLLTIRVKNDALEFIPVTNFKDIIMYGLLERRQRIMDRYNYSFDQSIASAYMFKPWFCRRRINKDYVRSTEIFHLFIKLVSGSETYYY